MKFKPLYLPHDRLPAGLRWLVYLALSLPILAHAGSISFGLAITGDKVTVTNQGNSSAYYPAVFRLLGNGHWQQLALPPGVTQPAELAAGAQLAFLWPDTRPLSSLPPLEALRPVMVRFFDQAGASFGQMSFFNQPLNAIDNLKAGYVDGKMRIAPPGSGQAIRATWLLWPQEEGIAPLRRPVQFTYQQPDARRIEWHSGMQPVQFDLGAGLPVAFLLHETAQGYALQVAFDGGVQGRQQRAGWLDRGQLFQRLAQWVGAAGILTLLWYAIHFWRRRPA